MSIARGRGHQISRIEGFSDAVFGFALTLLVVSLEVPASYAQLVDTMKGFLAFAVCFAFIIWIWVEHFHFFRRFAVEDGWTVFLNSLLLFVVLFYVYPLKFLFTALVRLYTGFGPAPAEGLAQLGNGTGLLRLYSAGFTVIFLVMTALYAHVYRSRHELELDQLALFDSRAGVARHSASAAVGLFSLLLTLFLPDRSMGLAGMVYAMLGPIHGVLGYRIGVRRQALARRSASVAPVAAG